MVDGICRVGSARAEATPGSSVAQTLTMGMVSKGSGSIMKTRSDYTTPPVIPVASTGMMGVGGIHRAVSRRRLRTYGDAFQ